MKTRTGITSRRDQGAGGDLGKQVIPVVWLARLGAFLAQMTRCSGAGCPSLPLPLDSARASTR